MINGEELTCISPLDGRYHQKTQALQQHFSEYALQKQRIRVECLWLLCLSELKEISECKSFSTEESAFIHSIYQKFSLADAIEIKEFEQQTNHDVKACEYYISRKLSNHPTLNDRISFIHFACTSEDINNISYALMLKESWQQVIAPMIGEILQMIRGMAYQYAAVPMLARTHGQAASPTTVGKEMANIGARIERQFQSLNAQALLAKLNGATGCYHAHSIAYPDIDWPIVCHNFVESLGLIFNPYTTQIEPHDSFCEFFAHLQLLNTILIDTSRDLWGYISLNYFKQKRKDNEVGSSTMPHKVNPIDFENAEGNLGIANALLAHFQEKLPISRWQRDLSDSTVQRNMGVAITHSSLAYQSFIKGLNKLELNEEVLKQDLADEWSLLAEPIQTVMRKYGINDAYEQLKALSRGQKLSQSQIHAFIKQSSLPQPTKASLLALRPETYLGQACHLAKTLIAEKDMR